MDVTLLDTPCHPKYTTCSGRIFCLVLLLLLPSQATASSGWAAPDTTAHTRGHFALLPIVFSSPDTRWALGVLPQYYFRTTPESRPSTLRLDAYYTQNRQFHVQLTPSFWWRQDTHHLSAKVAFKEWPTTFYGLGANTPAAQRESYTERFFSATVGVQRQLRAGLFVGLRYSWRTTHILDLEPGSVLARGEITGSDHSRVSGLGLLMNWDMRDHIFFPTTGHHHQLSIEGFGRFLGSDYGFAQYKLDLRRYILLRDRQVLALQAVGVYVAGDAPFWALSGVGTVLRGYPSARHRHKNLLAIQAEYRFVPVIWRLGFAVFAGVGQVARTPANFTLSRLKYAYGLGLRMQLFRDEQLNLRWDFGFGRHASGDYLDLPEAF